MVIPPEIQELLASKDRRIAELEALVAELLRRLGLDGANSSKPPSSDGLKKKPRAPRSLRGKSGKTSGGQEGHAGDTLRQVAQPDFVVPHEACVCRHCRLPLDPKAPIAIEKRQVFDLPERLLLVTEHQASIYRCANCRGVTKAAFPRRRGLAGAIWRALQGGGGLHERPAVDPGRWDRADDERRIRRASGLFGERRRLGGRERRKKLTPVYAQIGERVAGEKVAISTRRAIGSAASCNGCTRLRAFASPSIAPEKSAATFPGI